MSFKSNLINIVLVETSHPGNIGSVARAMKTMGLSNLSLVNPRKFPSGEANALSGNAGDVLENAQVFSSIEESIKENVTSLAGVPSWMLSLLNKTLEFTNKQSINLLLLETFIILSLQ